MECHYELNEGCLTISMPKELDHHSAEQLRMEADLLIDSYYCGGSVKAQHMNERIQKIFRISGLHKLMETEAVTNE